MTTAQAQVLDGTTVGQNERPEQRSYNAEDEQGLKFKSQAIIVQVPVVVTDRSGQHVHSLTQNDFKVLENGKAQKVASFEEITTTHSGMPALAPAGTYTNRVFTNEQPETSTIVVLDQINTPFLDQSYGRQALIKYLGENLRPEQPIALFTIGSQGVKLLSGFRASPAAVIAALKQVGSEAPAMQKIGSNAQALAELSNGVSDLAGPIGEGEDPAAHMRRFVLQADAFEAGYRQTHAIEDTMKAFLQIAWSLSGVPGRKSLIWATGGFPFTLSSDSTVPGGGLSPLYERTMDAFNQAQISVYPVDVRGILTNSADPTYASSAAGNVFALGRERVQESTLDSLRTFAAMTGGRAFYNNNDATQGFKQAMEDAQSYYLLTYYLDPHNTRPGWRRLQVQLTRKDVEVRARTGFFVTKATVDPQVTQKADIALALSSPLDSGGIVVNARWQNTSGDGNKKKVEYALQVPAAGLIDESSQNRFDLEFVAQATSHGVPATDKGQNVKGTLPAEALAKIKHDGIFYKNYLELPLGNYQVRFVVRDNLSGKIGSVTAPLSVK